MKRGTAETSSAVIPAASSRRASTKSAAPGAAGKTGAGTTATPKAAGKPARKATATKAASTKAASTKAAKTAKSTGKAGARKAGPQEAATPAKTAKASGPAKAAPPSKTAPATPPTKTAPATPPTKSAPTSKATSRAEPPVPDGTDWTSADLAAIRVELGADIRQMRSEYDQSVADMNDLQRAGADSAGDDQADAGSKTFEREQELSIAANRMDLLTQMQRAVERIDSGTYGFCERCGRPIPRARLRAFPMATLDVACKQREERR